MENHDWSRIIIKDLCVKTKTMEEELYKNPHKSGKNPLSIRERTLLQLAAKGYTTSDMAKLLFISEPTVETHRSNIIKKLQVKNMTEAVAHSLRNKLID